jgi:hypothetical protein
MKLLIGMCAGEQNKRVSSEGNERRQLLSIKTNRCAVEDYRKARKCYS